MKNILLVQAVDDYGLNKFLPLAIAYQWLYAALDPTVLNTWRVADVLIEKLPIDHYVDSLTDDIHMVAMSSYVWNFNYNNQLAKALRQRFPECVIVIGGPEVNKHDPDLIRNRPWFDVAVLGENEPVLRALLLGSSVEQVSALAGAVTRFTREIQQPTRTKDLEVIPSPILAGFYNDIMRKYSNRGQHVEYWQVTWETMRGCPYHCAFCDIGDDYWNKTIWFDLDRIYREIDWMGQHKIEYLSVCDSNWGIHPRDIDITRHIIATKLRTGYPRILDVTWAKNNPDRVRKIIELDQQAGTELLRGLNLSLQSMDQSTLKINARFNLVDKVLDETLQWYRDNRVPTFSEIIWPLPGETVESFTQGLQKVMDLGQRDFVVVHPLVSTNNSPLGQAAFRQSQGIKTARVPVDTFWMKKPDNTTYIVEYEDAVIATSTADYDDYLQGNMIAHWLGVLYYYGWAHHVMKYLRLANGTKETEVVTKFIDFCQHYPDSMIGQEHQLTVAAYRAVFEQQEHWGRLLDSPFEDIYWEYKSGTCIVFQQQRALLVGCLEDFLFWAFGIKDSDLVRLNLDMCVDFYNFDAFFGNYRSELTQLLFGIDSETVEIHHEDRELHPDVSDIKRFCARVYHHRRKMKHWCCDIRPA